MSKDSQKIHFISIGGSLMHSLAIALHQQGHTVTGSDDEIFEPSRSKLDQDGLLPDAEGWFPGRITKELECVILGMHAQKDNPELQKAQELGLTVYSAPEFIYNHCKNKQRVVIAGSHGKTTITAIIIHVLSYFNRSFDYALGASVPGFKNAVKLSDAPVIIIEGDEYPSSRLDMKPKFLNYHHHIGLLSGISWDHINVYKSEDEYVKQFDKFADITPKGGTLVYCEEDPLASVIGSKEIEDVQRIPYSTHKYMIDGKAMHLLNGEEEIPLSVIGRHNMQNLNGAMKLLNKLAVTDDEFYEAITSFKGAQNRLSLVGENETVSIYKDYAHAPSKVLATTRALKEQFPERDLIAVLELHTYSSLNKEFLPNYEGTLKYANKCVVYYNPQNVINKKLEELNEEIIAKSFVHPHLEVIDNNDDLENYLKKIDWDNKTVVFMSSGNFGAFDITGFSSKALKQ